ncbi:MAG: adenylate/guanylate cyclase domain-containing protein [Halieaceae bacterium]
MQIRNDRQEAGLYNRIASAEPLWIAIALFVLLWPLSLSPPWQGIENKGFDALTVSTAPDNIELPLVMVGIDQPSFAELAMPWPWPRSVHAELVQQLHGAGAAVIAFDIVFADPSAAADDQAFASAIAQASNVVLAGDLAYQEHELFEQLIRIDPLGLLLEAGAATGVASTAVDEDLVVRRLPAAQDAFWRTIVRTWNRSQQDGALGNPELPAGKLIRYLQPGQDLAYASYYQALDPQEMLPADFFRNKIVLIGLNLKATPDPGGARSDLFATPFFATTGWLSPGVELVATEVANGLLNRAITPAPGWMPVALMGAALLLATALMWTWQPLASAALVLLLCVGLALISVAVFAWRDFWLPTGATTLALLMYYLLRGATAFVRERRRRQAIRRAFEHYVPPAVVAQILSQPDLLELGGEKRQVTLLFTDLAGFTSQAEQLQAEQVAQVLNEHFSAMASIVINHGGTIDKFIGDAVMAFWGAPLEDDDQALHACQAAMAMQRAMHQLRQDFRARGLPEIAMRIGIHSGPAIVGNMGAADRFDYTAVGDSVNLASRLEGVNKLYGTGILVSQDVFRQLGGQLDLWPLDIVRVKGKSVPIEIFTCFGDPGLGPSVAAAVADFRQRDWQASLAKWRTLIDNEECQQIAALYTRRIEAFQQQAPDQAWDGSFALEKM